MDSASEVGQPEACLVGLQQLVQCTPKKGDMLCVIRAWN